MKAVGIVQARMGSSRLFGKILHPLQGLPLLAVLATRLQGSEVLSWWLATTRQREDSLTASWAKAFGWKVHQGSTQDVLSRFTSILRRENAQLVVRITADDPFTDAAVVNLMLRQAADMPGDKCLLAASPGRILPLGYAPAVARTESLLQAESEIPAGQDHHRSHVVSWLVDKEEAQEFEPPAHWPDRSKWRWTVDTIEDARMAQAAFSLFGHKWPFISYPEMAGLLDQNPEITLINAGVRQKSLSMG